MGFKTGILGGRLQGNLRFMEVLKCIAATDFEYPAEIAWKIMEYY